jgi:hypothetical protein
LAVPGGEHDGDHLDEADVLALTLGKRLLDRAEPETVESAWRARAGHSSGRDCERRRRPAVTGSLGVVGVACCLRPRGRLRELIRGRLAPLDTVRRLVDHVGHQRAAARGRVGDDQRRALRASVGYGRPPTPFDSGR